jgi:hypothetical protein
MLMNCLCGKNKPQYFDCELISSASDLEEQDWKPVLPILCMLPKQHLNSSDCEFGLSSSQSLWICDG